MGSSNAVFRKENSAAANVGTVEPQQILERLFALIHCAWLALTMMKLTKFRATNFRSVDADSVTALIGTNESGKTKLRDGGCKELQMTRKDP